MPGPFDDAYIINGGTAAITALDTTSECQNLCLGDPNSTNSGTVQMSGGNLYATQNENLGIYGPGTFTQSGGMNQIVGSFSLGGNAGSSGTYNLSGNGWLSTQSYEFVGVYGTGSFTQSGGTNNCPSASLILGYNAGSSGTYGLSGSGQLSANEEEVGIYGTGTFSQSGGINIGGDLYLGDNPGSSGTYSLSGSGQLSAASESIGLGAFQQSGGTNAVSSLGIYSGGSYLLAGGTLQVNSSSCQPGNLRRRRHAGDAQCERHFGSDHRHLAEPGKHLG